MRETGGIIAGAHEIWQWFAKSDTALAALSPVMLWQAVFLLPVIFFVGMFLASLVDALQETLFPLVFVAMAFDGVVAIPGAGLAMFVVWRAMRRRARP